MNRATFTKWIIILLAFSAFSHTKVYSQPIQILTAMVTNPSCYGGWDGLINYEYSGGIPPVASYWSDGVVTAAGYRDSLCAGLYSVYLFDLYGGWSPTYYYMVGQPQPLMLSITANGSICDSTCFGHLDGYLEAYASGGTPFIDPPYIHHWNTGEYGPVIVPDHSGWYVDTVRDYNGCRHYQYYEIYCPPQDTMSLNVSLQPGDCKIYTAATINAAGGDAIFNVPGGAKAQFRASNAIHVYPGSRIIAGGYFHCYVQYLKKSEPETGIRPDDNKARQYTIPEKKMQVAENLDIRITPNPTTGDFTLGMTGIRRENSAEVMIFDMHGEKMMQRTLKGGRSYSFSLDGYRPGIYIIKAYSGNSSASGRIVKM